MLRDSSDPAARSVLPRILADADPAIRFAAVQWVGEQRLVEFRPRLESGLAHGATSAACSRPIWPRWSGLDGVNRVPKDEFSGEEYILKVLLAEQTPAEVRALRCGCSGPIIPRWPTSWPDSSTQKTTIASGSRPSARCASARATTPASCWPKWPATRTPRCGFGPRRLLASRRATKSTARCCSTLASGGEPALRDEALRSLRGADLSAEERRRLDVLVSAPRSVTDLLSRVTRPKGAGGTSDDGTKSVAVDRGQWIKLLEGQGDVQAGERIYFHPKRAGLLSLPSDRRPRRSHRPRSLDGCPRIDARAAR